MNSCMNVSRYLLEKEDIALYSREICNQYLKPDAKRCISLHAREKTNIQRLISDTDCSTAVFDDAQVCDGRSSSPIPCVLWASHDRPCCTPFFSDTRVSMRIMR